MIVVFLAVICAAVSSLEACSSNYHFDYILFALQWPESFCETQKCTPHSDHWAIHGAWPENKDGSWPQNCCTKKPFDINVLKPIESELIAAWSSLKVGGTNSQFWSHEYEKHGTCAVESPMMKDELSYFKSTLAAFKETHLDQWLANAHIVPSETKQYTLQSIHEAVKKGLGYDAQIQCVHSKHHKFPVISQINLCLDKTTLSPFNCPASLHDRSCKTAAIGYLPSK